MPRNLPQDRPNPDLFLKSHVDKLSMITTRLMEFVRVLSIMTRVGVKDVIMR